LKVTNISEKHVASIFRVEEYAKKETNMKEDGLFFDPDDER
jgi:hypothetical protein